MPTPTTRRRSSTLIMTKYLRQAVGCAQRRDYARQIVNLLHAHYYAPAVWRKRILTLINRFVVLPQYQPAAQQGGR